MKHYIQFSALIAILLAATAPTVWSGEYIDVRDHGAVLNGSTDDTNALNSAIAAARSDGRAVYIPPGTQGDGSLAISSTIVIDGGTFGSEINPVMIEGAGMGVFVEQVAGGNPVNNASTIKWIGGGSGPMIRFIACQGSGFGMKKIKLNGNAGAAFGLEVDHSSYGTFEDVNVGNLSATAGWGVKVWSSFSGQPAKTCSWNRFSGLRVNVPAGAGAGLHLSGTGISDANLNTFIGTSIIYGGSRNAILLGFCDNNTFVETNAFQRPGGTGFGVYAWYGDSVSRADPPFKGKFPAQNLFAHYHGGAWVNSTGAVGAVTSAVLISNQGDTPVPNVQSGSLAWQDMSRGLWHGTGYKISLNFISTPANTRSQPQAVNVPGVRVGDAVVVTPPLAVSKQGGIYTAHVENSDLVWVYFHNTTSAAIDPGLGTFTIASH